jgi:hypothetical protein
VMRAVPSRIGELRKLVCLFSLDLGGGGCIWDSQL